MRIPCPLCGTRDRREFYYYGAADYLDRPAPGAPAAAWDAYLHLRDNPAGPTRDLWYHELGCAAWLVVERDTVTHAITAASLLPPGPAGDGAAAGRAEGAEGAPEAPGQASGTGADPAGEIRRPRRKAAKAGAPDATKAARAGTPDAPPVPPPDPPKPAGRKRGARE